MSEPAEGRRDVVGGILLPPTIAVAATSLSSVAVIANPLPLRGGRAT